MPAHETTQPVNIIYADNTVFKNKTQDFTPGHFDVLVKEIRQKQHPRVKKSRYLITRDEALPPPAAASLAPAPAPAPAPEQSTSANVTEKATEEEKAKEEEDKKEETGLEKQEPEKGEEVTPALEERLKHRSQLVAETAYFLTNRKRFVQFIKQFFGDYKTELATHLQAATCQDIKPTTSTDSAAAAAATQPKNNNNKNKLSLLVHQRLIADYLNHYTPYRGLLLFHGLGSGKTCSSIAIAEGFKNPNKQVIVMTPAALKANFLKEMQKCGDLVYRINQHWVWKPYDKLQPDAARLEEEMYLSPGYIEAHQGAWVVSPEASAPATSSASASGASSLMTRTNVTRKRKQKKQKLSTQLTRMLDKKYTHYNYNGGITQKTLDHLTEHGKVNPFDNKVIIIDEAHKFVTTIVNQLKASTKKSLSRVFLELYDLLLSAKNARILLLTGTPIVNYPNEAAVLFNILRGYIRTYEVKVSPRSNEIITNESLSKKLMQTEIAKQIDYFHYSPTLQTVTFTRNPFPFLNVPSTSTSTTSSSSDIPYAGVKRSNKAEDVVAKDDEETFLNQVLKELMEANLEIHGEVRKHNYKNLPDNLDAFVTRFFSSEGAILHKTQLSNRMVGLVSYFSGTPELLPTYNKHEPYHKVDVPMSNYQAEQYAMERSKEQQQEKATSLQSNTSANNEEIYEEPVSSYKIFSRLCCNYAFPQELGRPKPASLREQKHVQVVTGGEVSAEKEEEVPPKDGREEDEPAVAPSPTESEKKIAEEDAVESAEEKQKEPEPEPTKLVASAATTASSPRKTRKRRKRLDGKESSKDATEEDEADVNADADEETEEKTAEEEKEKDDDAFLATDQTYNEQIKQALEALQENGEAYLSKAGLEKHSPKFLKIIQNLQDSKHEGLHLVYSQFRTMEGLGIFRLALDYHGFAELKIEKDASSKTWQLKVAPEDMDKPKYVLYTGNQPKELKELLMNIYNGALDAVSAMSSELASALRKMADDNTMGEWIKVFMITASGAEGLDLKNTRYVHLMEPFWNMVRLEQVIGRAVRICSHVALPKEQRTVEAFLYLSVFSKAQLDAFHHPGATSNTTTLSATLRRVMTKDTSTEGRSANPITTDQNLYEIARNKEKSIAQMRKVIKEASIDCTVYPRNVTEEKLTCFAQPADEKNSLEYSYLPNYEQDLSTEV